MSTNRQRTNWKRANKETANRLMETEDKLESTETILQALVDCGSADLECVYDMERNHPGTIDRAIEIKDELGSINFGNFVMGVKDQALGELQDEEITEQDRESFQDMIVDDNYVAWGSVAAYGSYEDGDKEANHERQELFANFVTGTSTREEFLKEYRAKVKEVVGA